MHVNAHTSKEHKSLYSSDKPYEFVRELMKNTIKAKPLHARLLRFQEGKGSQLGTISTTILAKW